MAKRSVHTDPETMNNQIPLAAVLASSFDPLLVIDSTGIIWFASDSVESVFGWSIEDLRGENISKLMPEPYRSAHDGYLQKYLLTSEHSVLGKIRNFPAVRKDGSSFPCELRAVRVDVPGNEAPWFAGVIRDVTERKQQEKQIRTTTDKLRALNEDLMQSNKELDDFAYIASHDLKEPLRGIHNYSAFLIADYSNKLDEKGIEMLSTLGRLTKRMEDLIDRLWIYSRLGRVDFAMKNVDLNETVSSVLETLQAGLNERGAEVRIPRPLPTVYCDHSKVSEIFRNLVTNAIKYNDGQPVIEIGYNVEGAPSSGSGVSGKPVAAQQPIVFYVRDNGIGIAKQHQERIFDMFKRLHGREKYSGGTGAGLTIVKKIVDRHGGRIWVESDPGKGSTFFFTLVGH